MPVHINELMLMQLLSMNYGELNCHIYFFMHLFKECRYLIVYFMC